MLNIGICEQLEVFDAESGLRTGALARWSFFDYLRCHLESTTGKRGGARLGSGDMQAVLRIASRTTS
jgi:hypothetical protein